MNKDILQSEAKLPNFEMKRGRNKTFKSLKPQNALKFNIQFLNFKTTTNFMLFLKYKLIIKLFENTI